MNQTYVCPGCKSDFTLENNTFSCTICKTSYILKDNFVDFISDKTFYAGEVPQAEMKVLINNIDKIGFNSSLNLFFKKFPQLRSYITDRKRVDWVYNVLGTERENCLDIGSGLGNISEGLSYLFENVYSFEAVKERIEFQKRRFAKAKRTNITISRGNALSLPFKDNYFDLIVCNGVLEWMGMMNTDQNPRKTQLAFLIELKRVLKDTGKIYIGIENRFGANLILGDKDHSGLPYTSLMPRFLANYIVRKYGNLGGIYGDKTINKREENGYFTFTYSIYGYKSLFREAGLKTKSFWVYPSYNQPYFNGNLEDKEAIKGFIETVNSQPNFLLLSTSRIKTLVSIANKVNKSLLQFVLGLLSPSFLFYCGKNELDLPILEYLTLQTSLQSMTSLSSGDEIKYLLYDDNGKLQKIAHLKRDFKSLPAKIYSHDKTNPNELPVSSEKIWIENWIPGRNLDPLNFKEVKLALDWLTKYQESSSNESMTHEFLMSATEELKNVLKSNTERDPSDYIDIIGRYENYVISKHVSIRPEHGDYYFGNILIDEFHNIRVIDWAYFRKRGDPFFDPCFYIAQIAIYHKKWNRSEQIIDILNKKEFRELRDLLNNHFGFELDFHLLIASSLIRFVCRIISKKGIFDEELLEYYGYIDNIMLHAQDS